MLTAMPFMLRASWIPAVVVGVLVGAPSCTKPSGTTAPPSSEPVLTTAPSSSTPPEPSIAPARASAPEPPPADPFVLVSGPDGILPPATVAALPAIGAAPLVRLLDAGAEPRAELRYAVTTATKASLEMTMDLQLVLRMAENPLPTASLPPMVMVFAADLGAPGTGDGIRVSSSLRSSKSKGRDAAERKIGVALDPKLAKLVGMTMDYVLDNRGFVREATLTLPPDLPADMAETVDQMRQSLTSLAVPLPAEPVGVGARWQVLKRITAGGVDTAQLGSYTMIGRVGDDVELAVDVVQFAAAPQVQTKGLTAEIERYQALGGGTSRVRMSEPFTLSASMEVVSDVVMRVAAAGQEVVMGARATLLMTMAGKTGASRSKR